MATIGVWLRATRPQFLTITIVAVALGWASAVSSGVPIDWRTAVLTLLGALCVHAGANLVNDYHDREADANNSDRLSPYTGGSRMIQDGLLSARAVARYGYLLVGATIAIGLSIAALGPTLVVWIGALGLAAAVAYSAPPLRLSARGWGELAVAAAWLLVVVGADVVQRQAWSVRPFAAGVSVACLVCAILWVNEFPDAAADLRAGKRTIVVRLGRVRAAWVHLGLVVVAYGWLLAVGATAILPGSAYYGLSALPLSLYAALTLLGRARTQDTRDLLPAIKSTIAAAHVHGIGLVLGLLLPGGSG